MGEIGTGPRVLSVGQCGADQYRLTALLRQHFAAEVEACATAAEAERRLTEKPFALVLVNRVLDADGASGLGLIRRLAGGTVPVMLVSDRADAQAEAVRAGARPGFGKAQLSQPQTRQRLEAVLTGDQGF